MSKNGNYERKVYEPTKGIIMRRAKRIREGWTLSKRKARGGEAMDRNDHPVGWLPPEISVADFLGHPDATEDDNR